MESPNNVHVIFGSNRGLNMESKYMTKQTWDQWPGYKDSMLANLLRPYHKSYCENNATYESDEYSAD